MKQLFFDLLWRPARNVVQLLPVAFATWRENAASRLAAALAFYTVFSLAPTIIIALAIAGAVLGEGHVRSQVLAGLEGLLGTTPAFFALSVVDSAQRGLTGRWAAVAVLTLLAGATVVFSELHAALNRLWEVESRTGIRGFFYRRLVGFLMVLVIGLLLLASLIAGTVLSAVERVVGAVVGNPTSLWRILNSMGAVVLSALLFAAMYKVLPDVKIEWSDVAPASIVTSFLFAVGRFLIGLYLSNTSLSSVYGAAGSFVIILLWIYYSAQIFLFGAQLSYVYTTRFGSRTPPGFVPRPG
ncbi:MAG: YihY/virulence factor BrkB family protein [Acidobacteria bacterium]|nr:YihY/virulence factor BrkB family protein [Acidobacteriota bacterium]